MNKMPALDDLRVFLEVARRTSFSAAASALGQSPAYVSKRIRLLEADLGVPLLHRTTRQVVVTDEGERAFHWAKRILEDMNHMVQDVAGPLSEPLGLLRISTSVGYGRHVVAPALSQLVRKHPGLQVRLEVFDRLVDVITEGFDLDVRVGDDISPHLIAQRLANNHRVLCASPSYVQRRGLPHNVAELSNHDCLVIKERDHPFGVWRLVSEGQQETVKVHGPLSANHGEMVVQWALDGLGIALRSQWDVAQHFQSGRLVPVLPEWTQQANVWAVYQPRKPVAAKVQACVAFLQSYLSSPS